VPQVRKGKPDLKENREYRGLKDLKDLKESRDLRVIPGFKENKVPKVHW
jgi:hypothetical protein